MSVAVVRSLPKHRSRVEATRDSQAGHTGEHSWSLGTVIGQCPRCYPSSYAVMRAGHRSGGESA